MPAAFDAFLRKYSTHAAAALSVVVAVTGVMMFFRLGKAQVEQMHEWLGLAFVAAFVLHVLRHRTGFAAMLGQSRMHVLAGAAALVTVAFLTLAPPKPANPFRESARLLTGSPLSEVAPLLDIPAADLAARLGTEDTARSMNDLARERGGDPVRLLVQALARN